MKSGDELLRQAEHEYALSPTVDNYTAWLLLSQRLGVPLILDGTMNETLVVDARMAQILFDEQSEEDRELCIFYTADGVAIQIMFVKLGYQIPKHLIKLPHINVSITEFNAWSVQKIILDDHLYEPRRRCPKCNSSKNVKEIVFGYAPTCNENQVLGGCVISADGKPERWRCVTCKVNFPSKPLGINT